MKLKRIIDVLLNYAVPVELIFRSRRDNFRYGIGSFAEFYIDCDIGPAPCAKQDQLTR